MGLGSAGAAAADASLTSEILAHLPPSSDSFQSEMLASPDATARMFPVTDHAVRQTAALKLGNATSVQLPLGVVWVQRTTLPSSEPDARRLYGSPTFGAKATSRTH